MMNLFERLSAIQIEWGFGQQFICHLFKATCKLPFLLKFWRWEINSLTICQKAFKQIRSGSANGIC